MAFISMKRSSLFLLLASLTVYLRSVSQVLIWLDVSNNAIPISLESSLSSPMHSGTTTSRTSSLADGCSCVFLDVGANRGIQTRKLFEPNLYEGARWPGQFKSMFGDISYIREHCCSFGFEPNPIHQKELRKLSDTYNKKGWRTTFFEKAAWKSDGNLTYMHEFAPGKSDGKELSSRLAVGEDVNNPQVEIIPTMDLGKFIREHILTRKWRDDDTNVVANNKSHNNPKSHDDSSVANTSKGVVLMKLDTEGAEYTIIPNLLSSGALCNLDVVAIEWHPFRRPGQVGKWLEDYNVADSRGDNSKFFQHLLQLSDCPVKLIDFDDESHYASNFSLPKV